MENIKSTITRMYHNPFISVAVPVFSFMNGISVIIYIPEKQKNKIDELLSRYSSNSKYYEVYAYLPKEEFGK